ncbi:MAG: glutamate-cysteine ligase family protein [Nannocystaceae bacterium]
MKSSAPPLQRRDMLAWFENSQRRENQLIGTEQEKFGVCIDRRRQTVVPVDYAQHISPLLSALCERFGWQPSPERGVDGETVGLVREGASITLEPGGQLELSGAPLRTLHETCEEFTNHQRELHEAASSLDLAFLAAGFHPFARREEINWMPKGRYRVMRDYLPQQGGQGLDMMLRTCTVQANFDYADEQQCGRRLKLALESSSLVTAVFANSPYREGRDVSYVSTRSAVWSDVDPARCGLLGFAMNDAGFSYEHYVDWALDVPMFFVKRGNVYHPHHAPFRTFMQRGFRDVDQTLHRASRTDWELHLSTLFPEVRLKPYLEIRGADSVSSKYLCAVPAFAKGLLCDEDALEEASSLLAGLDFAQRLELWEEARRYGLKSPRVHKLCKRLLALARDGLDRIDIRDASGRSEARYLDSLEPLVESGLTPADEAITDIGPNPGTDEHGRRACVRQFYFAGVEL